MKIIFDTSAFIPENKPEREREAIIALTKRLPDLDITIYVSREILKEYRSKLKLFPGRFPYLFKNVILKAYRYKTCKSLPFHKLKIHRIEPKINLDMKKIEKRCGKRKYHTEDEKFLKLFIYLGQRGDIYLITLSEDLACMAREAIRLYNLRGHLCEIGDLIN